MEKIRIGIYRHYKGKEYRVLHLAKHSETLENMVVYQALYGAGEIWVRPADMWSETVRLDGGEVSRFTFIRENSQIQNTDTENK